jgi:hypothetical protein
MTSNMAITKIESMTKNYPEFLVANLNYAGGHAGHPNLRPAPSKLVYKW